MLTAKFRTLRDQQSLQGKRFRGVWTAIENPNKQTRSAHVIAVQWPKSRISVCRSGGRMTRNSPVILVLRQTQSLSRNFELSEVGRCRSQPVVHFRLWVFRVCRVKELITLTAVWFVHSGDAAGSNKMFHCVTTEATGSR